MCWVRFYLCCIHMVGASGCLRLRDRCLSPRALAHVVLRCTRDLIQWLQGARCGVWLFLGLLCYGGKSEKAIRGHFCGYFVPSSHL